MNVTPLVDVVLVLLIIFMVVAPQLDQDVQVNLPGIFNVDPDVEGNVNPFKVSVAHANEFYVEEQQYDLKGIIEYLATQHAAEPDRRLLLRADSQLKYGSIRQFMGQVQAIGFPGLNFMVGERHRQDAVRATAEYGSQQEIPADAAPADQAAPEQPPSEAQPAPDAQPDPAADAGGS
jgi:biopolymer transport protein ExbD/biopolymer transport protein TolR